MIIDYEIRNIANVIISCLFFYFFYILVQNRVHTIGRIVMTLIYECSNAGNVFLQKTMLLFFQLHRLP